MALPVSWRPPGVEVTLREERAEEERRESLRLKIDKNELFLRSLCEWCMKRSRSHGHGGRRHRNGKSKKHGFKRISFSKLERKADELVRSINMETRPLGWLETLKNEHGVLFNGRSEDLDEQVVSSTSDDIPTPVDANPGVRYAVPICQWWLKCPHSNRLFLDRPNGEDG